MRHHNKNRKFGREQGPRRALLASLARNLILRGKITTSEAKAKSLRPLVEKLVTKAKTNTLATRKLLIARLGTTIATKTLLENLGPRYATRPGGYTRIIKLPARKSDGSPQAMIEFV